MIGGIISALTGWKGYAAAAALSAIVAGAAAWKLKADLCSGDIAALERDWNAEKARIAQATLVETDRLARERDEALSQATEANAAARAASNRLRSILHGAKPEEINPLGPAVLRYLDGLRNNGP